jgi:hypothetical protein
MHIPTVDSDVQETEIKRDGVCFLVTDSLKLWLRTATDISYWFYAAEVIVRTVHSEVRDAVVEKVELYGAPDTGFVYAKFFAGGRVWQQQWRLAFPNGRMLFFKVS